jgi:probable addiction module antidote protein
MVSLVNFKETLIEDLKDPHYARTYLSIALETYEKDKDSVSFLTALRDVAEARGGMTQLSRKTNLNRENLYKVLSSKGNPRFSTIETLLHGLGFRLDIQPIGQIA